MTLFGRNSAFSAEFGKQHASRASGKMTFFSLLLWPSFSFLTAFYTMAPYRNGEGSALARYIPGGDIPMFLLSGYLVFQLFWTVVQSAWMFEQERKEGTLELVFMAPSSKMGFLLGRSCYALLHGIWMFAVFSVFVFGMIVDPSAVGWPELLGSLLLIAGSAVVWGALLNALALFSRDSAFLYYLFQAPMELLGGVRIPPQAFPPWAAALSLLFPVTYSLRLVRGALYGNTAGGWWTDAVLLAATDLVLLFACRLLLGIAERNARLKGSWSLF